MSGPFLCVLEDTLTGIHVGPRNIKTAVIACADAITIFVTSQLDIPNIQNAIDTSAAASGARFNVTKSKAMAIGSWDTSTNILNIPYHTEIKILGIHYTITVHQSAKNNWTTVTGNIGAQTRNAYNRDLCLDKRIMYVHNFLLTKTWNTAQIFRKPEDRKRQISMVIAWFLWQGDIFRVPLSTLQQQKQQGVWGFINIAAKIRALFFYRLQPQGQENATITTEC